jgi:DNA mismatch repair protein MutS
VFLHRILAGSTDRSYGIHVAQLAGIPRTAVARAKEILGTLEVHAAPRPARGRGRQAPADAMPLFAPAVEAPAVETPAPHPALERLRGTDLESITPLQAFDLLRSLKEEARDA